MGGGGRSGGRGKALGGGGIIGLVVVVDRGAAREPGRWRFLGGRAAGGGRRHEHLAGLPDRCRREPAPGLPARRGGQLGAGVLAASGAGLHRRDDDPVQRADAVRLRSGVGRDRAVLLPGRSARVHRSRVLRRAHQPLRRAGRAVRGGVRDRARVRPPRAEPARDGGSRRQRPRRTEVGVGAARAPGRLLRRRVGGERGRHRAGRERSPTTTSPTASTPRPRSATTGSSRPRRGPSTRSRGRTGRRASARSGSPIGYRSGDPNRCDTFAADAL